MSRVAKRPVVLPQGVEFNVSDGMIMIKGPKGSLSLAVHASIDFSQEENEVKVNARDDQSNSIAIAGTFRSLIANMVTGVTDGFERKLKLVGIGYRAQAQGNQLNLTLGFSHPVNYTVPEGITIETPSQTEIVVTGIDKQKVGQVAAEIRAYRPPEPYKGKGVRYSDERVSLKEAKKK
jgi:large subunit ribosomal protein L6